MTSKLKLLDEVIIAAPCPVSWESMTGDNRVRLCSGCTRNVYNISDMTRGEAEEFLLENGTTQCMQIYRRPDGKVMTDNCPRAFRKIRDKCRLFVRVFSGLAASILAFIPVSRNSVSAQEESWRGDVYIPPDKQSAATPKAAKPEAGAASAGSCKKIMIGPDECAGAKSNTVFPVKGEAVAPVPVMAPGMVAFPVKGQSVIQELPKKSSGVEKPDLRDSRALNLYLSARKSDAEGKSMLAQTQYIEALKAAVAQKDGDPKFKLLIQESCNKLRHKLNMPPVDLEGKEIGH